MNRIWHMKNTMAEMHRVIDEVEQFVSEHSENMKLLYAVRLTLDELLSNIVKYAYRDQDEHSIEVALNLDQPVTLTLTEDGHPFDPLKDAPAPVLDGPIEDRPIGGLGLHMIQSMGIHLAYRRDGSYNVLQARYDGADYA